MAKKSAAASTSTSSKPSSTTTTTATSTPPQPSSKTTTPNLSSKSSPRDVAVHIWNDYIQNTPSRTFLLDAFLGFLVLVGVIQFVYAVLFGNYPFNAFLSGFSAAVGQFVLTVSLRMQTTERLPATASAEARKSAAKKIDGSSGDEGTDENGRGVSSERAFADYVFGSLILHGFCVNFIN